MVSETNWESEYLRSAVRKSSILLTAPLSASTHISLTAFLQFDSGILRLEKPTQLNADFKLDSDKYAWQIKIITANIKNWVSFSSVVEKPAFCLCRLFFFNATSGKKNTKIFWIIIPPDKRPIKTTMYYPKNSQVNGLSCFRIPSRTTWRKKKIRQRKLKFA